MPLTEGTEVAVSLTAVPHYYRQSDGSYPFDGLGAGSTMTTTFTIDNTAPEALDIDLSQIEGDKLTVTARDNRHVAAVALLNANGSRKMSVKSPNQTEPGREVTVELDLSKAYGTEFLVAVYDYANNMTAYRVEMDLGTMEREYFTAIDYNTMTYVGVDRAGQTSFIAETGLPLLARAAEYVGGHVFVITTDNSLCVANDENLSVTERICQLDPDRECLITGVNDLAPAPGAPGNSRMAVYGGNVLHVDATTGDYYNWYYMFSHNLVALAYVGTQPYNYGSYDTMVDWYFIIDRLGYVYLMGFLEQDGRYYYLEHDTLAPKGIYTKLDFEMDTPYYGSAYFDGEMLYYSAYKESQDQVTLMAIDVAGGSKACYELGTFSDGIWPVAGLMEIGQVENHIGIIMPEQALGAMSQPVPVQQQTALKGIRKDNAQGTLEERLTLTLEAEKPHAHSYTAVVTEPSCTEGGLHHLHLRMR